MPSLIDLRRRIRSVKNTEQITKAMKMVASAKLRRAQERVLASRPYSEIYTQMLSDVAGAVVSAGEEVSHPLLAVREQKRILLVVVTSDRGLAGAFNANITKAGQVVIAAHPKAQFQIEAIGRRAECSYKSLDPVRREANSPRDAASPRQKSRTVSRYLPFHSVHSGGKLPTW